MGAGTLNVSSAEVVDGHRHEGRTWLPWPLSLFTQPCVRAKYGLDLKNSSTVASPFLRGTRECMHKVVELSVEL